MDRHGVLYLGWVSCACCGCVYSFILSRVGDVLRIACWGVCVLLGQGLCKCGMLVLLGGLCCGDCVCWVVLCGGVCLSGGGWGMVGMRQVSKGLFLAHLWLDMWYEPLVGGSICDVVCGAVPASCRGDRAACLVMVLWHV